MIKIRNVTKYYPSKFGRQYVFNDLSFDIPSDRNIAILGPNGAGKSTLFRLISGTEFPDSGNIYRDINVSWPVALATGVHPKMTGRENTRFIGRVQGVADLEDYERRVQRFARLGQRFDLPVNTYSSGMRARLAFGCCIIIPFDLYLIDEATAVGDAKFQARARKALKKRVDSNLLFVSHDMKELRTFCDSAIIVNDGKVKFVDDFESAVEEYKTLG